MAVLLWNIYNGTLHTSLVIMIKQYPVNEFLTKEGVMPKDSHQRMQVIVLM